MKRSKVGIVGGTGYTGAELLRLLLVHPHVEVAAITSRSEAGQKVGDYFPSLRGRTDLAFSDPESGDLDQCEIVFFATPHTVAASQVGALLAKGIRVIDLSADFRLADKDQWEQWYKVTHPAPGLFGEAVYGLPEVHREAIASARLVACPGCYPTAILLGLLPLLDQDFVDLTSIIADAKSGVSGAGRAAAVGTLLCETSENFKTYAANGHRHLPELIQHATSSAGGRPLGLTFVPHLVPMMRGMEATLYIRRAPSGTSESGNDAGDPLSPQAVHDLFSRYFESEPFVDVLPLGQHPETRSVKGTNICRIGIFRQPGDGPIIISSVIDNVVKGASGQAVQNMNLMLGLPEIAGLDYTALLPG
ncbi:N-acetyl-gamma-glutamyl-phosphate reductase [Allohahella marinimesophila]|uniref:N-acetyl-gamma-glutamyl-phosphate reductase n=1 Tax=Allohahella marinimesophila TaxID=1054972 RepID=A0ABP7P5E2_9GAMM